MKMLVLALIAGSALAQTPQHMLFKQPNLPRPLGPAGITGGLQAWWAGGNLGSTWNDASGNGRNMTLAGASSTVPTQITSWELNGVQAAKFYQTNTQYAEVGTASDFTFLTQSTGHSGYVQFVLQAATGGILASSFGSSFGNGPGLGLWISGQQLSIYISNGAGAVGFYVSSASFLQYGVPTTVVWRLNGTTNKFNVRINGVEVNNTNSSGYTNTAPTHKLRIGAYSTPTSGSPFGGLVSDFALWNRPLSDAEVTQLEAWANRAIAPAFAASTAPLSSSLTGTVKVMFVGDSITAGVTGASTLVGGYRHRVFDLSCGSDAGFTIDGIGPYIGTLVPNGYADNQSNGVGGAIIKNAAAGQAGHATGSSTCVAAPGGCINTIIGTGNSYRPDVISVLLGINNIAGIAESDVFSVNAAGDYCDFILDMHQREPAARFIVASLLPKIPNSPFIDAFNRSLMACTNYLWSVGVPVVRVDANAAMFALPSLDAGLADGLHPNDTGYAALGDVWCPAIQRATGNGP